MNPLEAIDFPCPYCGAENTTLVDNSLGACEYLEDCRLCCQPILIRLELDEEGFPLVEARREND